MKIWQSLGDLGAGRRILAIGTFDGVHLGHRAVVGLATSWAAEVGLPTLAATFHPRPATVVAGIPSDALASLSYRAALIESLGVDELLVLRFDDALRQMDAETFVRGVIAERAGAAGVVVGTNFHFGRGRGGTAESLARHCATLGIETRIAPLVEVDGEAVSSSRIRELVQAGEVAAAGRLLGRPVTVEGAVVKGEQRGREWGIPTANLRLLPGLLVPADGVYAGAAVAAPGERRFKSAISVGTNPQFGAGQLRVEAHLIDFDEDLYGAPLRLELRHLLRRQAVFESTDALFAQIHADVAAARAMPF